MSMYENKEDFYKAKSNYYENKTKDLQQELARLKNDAYFMRVVIHEKGLHDWQPEPKERMEKILYGDTDKLIGID